MKASKRFIFAALPAFLLGGCFFTDRTVDVPVEPEPRPQDSTITAPVPIPTKVEIKPSGAFNCSMDKVDLFVYSDTLECHLQALNERKIEMKLLPGKIYTIVAIANAFGNFNDAALSHYDAWESFVYKLSYEKEGKPLMRGKGACIAGKDTEVSVEPIGSIIQLRSIEQDISDETIIESPRVWLENVNRSAVLFRESPYNAEEQITTYPILLNDIGLYTQYPNVNYYVYPNEQATSSINPALRLILEYELNGITMRYEQEIHPIIRNTIIPFDIILD